MKWDFSRLSPLKGSFITDTGEFITDSRHFTTDLPKLVSFRIQFERCSKELNTYNNEKSLSTG